MAPSQCNQLLGFIQGLTERPDSQQIITQHLPFQLIGIFVVMLTLTGLYLMCLVLGAFFRKSASVTSNAPSPTLPLSTPITPTPDDMDTHLTAAIAAAVAIVLEQPHRVLAIESAAAPASQTSAWAIEGRFQHFSSHKVR